MLRLEDLLGLPDKTSKLLRTERIARRDGVTTFVERLLERSGERPFTILTRLATALRSVRLREALQGEAFLQGETFWVAQGDSLAQGDALAAQGD